MTGHARISAFVHVYTGIYVHIQLVIQETFRIISQEIVIQFVMTAISGIYMSALVHVGRSISIVFVNQRVVQVNLWSTYLTVIVRIVEAHTIGKFQLFNRGDIYLYFTVNLLRSRMVVIVFQCPVGVCDTVRSKVRLRCIER